MRRACRIELSEEERATLEQWSRGRRTPARVVQRAKIVLRAAAGMQNKAIAAQVGCGRDTVAQWRLRFRDKRLAGLLKDAPRAGRRPSRRAQLTKPIVNATLHKKPENATHWSTRSLAGELGISPSMVQRVWKMHGLKPHRVRSFTPTSASWLNLIERWFRELTGKRIRRGVFKSVQELVHSIMNYIEHHNANPRPFTWTAKSDDILAKIGRANASLNKMATA